MFYFHGFLKFGTYQNIFFHYLVRAMAGKLQTVKIRFPDSLFHFLNSITQHGSGHTGGILIQEILNN